MVTMMSYSKRRHATRSTFVGLAATAVGLVALAAAPPAHGEEFIMPSKCKELVRYDDALGRDFKAAGQRYDAFNGGKQLLDDALAEASKDAYWNTGNVATLRTAAYVINRVCEATSHTIAGLTPEGAVVGTAAEAAGVAKEILERWIQRIALAKAAGQKGAEAYVQPGKVRENQSRVSATIDFATSDEVVKVVQALAKKAGLEHLAPLSRNVAELWKARQSIMDAIAAGQLNDQQVAAELTARQQIDALKSNIREYQLAMRIELDSMAPLQAVHDAVQATVRASCTTKPCDDVEKRALDRRTEKRDEADALWGRANELRKNGPDLKANNQSKQSIRDQNATLEKEAQDKHNRAISDVPRIYEVNSPGWRGSRQASSRSGSQRSESWRMVPDTSRRRATRSTYSITRRRSYVARPDWSLAGMDAVSPRIFCSRSSLHEDCRR
jgi:hypothetical protein